MVTPLHPCRVASRSRSDPHTIPGVTADHDPGEVVLGAQDSLTKWLAETTKSLKLPAGSFDIQTEDGPESLRMTNGSAAPHSQHLAHIPQLDGLRAMAILAVLVDHFGLHRILDIMAY